MVVTTDVALCAVHTGSLRRAIPVDVLLTDGKRVLKIIAEEYVNVDKLRVPAARAGGTFEKLLPEDFAPRIVGDWDRSRAQNLFGDCIIRKQAGLLASAGPAVIENLLRRNHENVCVDKRAATEACTNDDVHMFVITDIEDATGVFSRFFHQPADVPRTTRLLAGLSPEIASKVVRLPRKRSHGIALASLKDEDFSSGPFLGQAASGDGSPKTCPHYDCFVAWLSHDFLWQSSDVGSCRFWPQLT